MIYEYDIKYEGVYYYNTTQPDYMLLMLICAYHKFILVM